MMMKPAHLISPVIMRVTSQKKKIRNMITKSCHQVCHHDQDVRQLLGLRQICQHNKKHSRLECYASIMQHIRCIFQPIELTFVKADRYFLIEQSLEAANCNKTLKCIGNSPLDRYPLIEQSLYSKILK